MQYKPPNRSASALDLIETEIIAAALGRLGRGLETALQALLIMDKLKLTVNEEKTRICKVPEGQDFDAAHAAAPSDAGRRHRAALVAEAGYALWLFVVQREACGLRDSRAVMRDYTVPTEVHVRMGLPPPQPQGKRRRSSPSRPDRP